MGERRVCLLIEDQPLTRAWMRDVLTRAFPGITVVEQASLRSTHLWLDTATDPAWLAVVDIGLSDGSGIELVQRIAQQSPQTRIVVATIYNDDAHLMEAIAAGAGGYVLKDEEPERLIETLRRIENDEPSLSPSIARRMLTHFRAPGRAPRDEARLTPREVETLTLLARGLTVAEAAAQLGLTPHTVAGYVKLIYQKLNISTRAEATREAIRRGLA